MLFLDFSSRRGSATAHESGGLQRVIADGKQSAGGVVDRCFGGLDDKDAFSLSFFKEGTPTFVAHIDFIKSSVE